MKDSEKFDNRDGAPAKPKKAKEEELDEGKKKGDGNLANNAKPYDKVTKGDVIAGRLGKDEKGGKVKEAKEEKFDALKHVKNPTKGEKEAAKDVKRGSYPDRSAMLKSAEADGRLKEAAKQTWNNIKETQAYIAEKAKSVKPDYADLDDDGNEKESMKDAAKQAKKEVVKESADLNRMKEFLTRLNG